VFQTGPTAKFGHIFPKVVKINKAKPRGSGSKSNYFMQDLVWTRYFHCFLTAVQY